jgi:hypothetical protein
MKSAIDQLQMDASKQMGVGEEFYHLEVAANKLDDSITRMGRLDNPDQAWPRKPTGLVPTTHEVIFNHSRIPSHPRWVWIARNSTMDKDGQLGFLASRDEIRKFGAGARRVFLRKPPSQLLHSFAKVVSMGREDECPPPRPWKRRGVRIEGIG